MSRRSIGTDFQVGHWTDETARTGCTVVLFPAPALTAVDVRGGAPATRETDVFGSGRLVRRSDAILLTGGSAFGLESAAGVMRYLAGQERGYPTAAGPVPIVPAAAIYDLGVGEARAPGVDAGEAACLAARPIAEAARGQVGAGTGATTGRLGGAVRASRGGFGVGQVHWSSGGVTALVVVNAYGDVVDPISGRRVTAPAPDQLDRRAEIVTGTIAPPAFGTSTTLTIVIVAVPCDHDALVRCAISAHDGLARAIRPCHTPYDGDIVFAVGPREGPVPVSDTLRLSVATELAVEAAVVDAVTA